MNVSIIIPAYNEEEGIKKTVLDVKKTLPNAEIILVDDGSKDNTWKIMKKLSKNKNIKSYKHKKNKGKAHALKTGYKKAKNEIIGTIDSDYTYPPKHFPKMIKKFKKGDYDMIIGSRFIKGFPKKYPFLRAFFNQLGAFVTSLILFHKVTDVTTGMRVFNKKVAKLPTRAKSLDYEAELTGRVIKSGMKYGEVPITMKPRLGVSKLHLIKHIINFFIAMLRGAILKNRK